MQRLTENPTFDVERLKGTAPGYLRALHLRETHKKGGEIPTALRVWIDHRGCAVDIEKSADIGIADSGTATAVSDSLMEMAREVAILPQLVGMREVPFNVPFFIQTTAVTAAQVDESKPIPVFRGTWTKQPNLPRKFAGIVVVANDALQGPSLKLAQAATADAVKAGAEARDAAFAADVFGSSPSFSSSGPDEDLRRLCDLMPSGPGLSWIMSKETATYLSLTGSSGGGAARFRTIGPDGGELLGRQVLITAAAVRDDSPAARVLGLIDPRRVFWTPGSATVTRSTQAGLEMSSRPTGAPDTPTAASQYVASLFQSEATAIKVVLESGWHAADDVGVYTLVDY